MVKMGMWDNLKKSGGKFVKNQQAIGKVNAKARAERREYEKKVQKSVLTARRDAYHIEAQKSAKIKAKMDAQRRFNPSPQQQSSGGMSAEARSLIYGGGWGSPTQTSVSHQVASKIQKSRSSTKKKKKGSTKKRSPQKRSSAPKQSTQKSDFHNLLYNS